MTRKHYVALAKALASTRPIPTNGTWGKAEKAQWTATRDALTDYLATTNDLFDRARFVAATEA